MNPGAGKAPRTKERRPSVATLVRRRVAHSHERFWIPSDFSGLPRRPVLRALDRLEQQGELRRVRRGVYWRGKRPDGGVSAPTPEQLVAQITGLAGVGPAGELALWALGISLSPPARTVVCVPARAPRRIEGIELRSRAGRTGRIEQRLSPKEVALLEVLEDTALHERAALEGLRPALADLRLERLVRAAASEPAIVRQGLVNLLEAAGEEKLSAQVPPCFGLLARERAWRALRSE